MFIALLSIVEKRMKISNQALDVVTEVPAASIELPALPMVFQFLDLPSLDQMRLVNKYWKECVDQALLEPPQHEFEDHDELQRAVDAYCVWLPDFPPVLHHRLRRRKFIIECQYGKTIGTWKVSKVEEFCSLFEGKIHFNESLEDWDVSNATSTAWMFYGAAAFNQPLNKCDVRKVVRMNCMFLEASSFDQDLAGWNTNNVQFARCMFERSPIADRYRRDLQLLKKWGWDIMVSRQKEQLSNHPYYQRRGDTPLPIDEAVWEYMCETSKRKIDWPKD